MIISYLFYFKRRSNFIAIRNWKVPLRILIKVCVYLWMYQKNQLNQRSSESKTKNNLCSQKRPTSQFGIVANKRTRSLWTKSWKEKPLIWNYEVLVTSDICPVNKYSFLSLPFVNSVGWSRREILTSFTLFNCCCLWIVYLFVSLWLSVKERNWI